MAMSKFLLTLGLFILTAIAELIGCYLPYLMFNQHKTCWLIIPTVLSLAVFVYLLTLHPAASGRIYAAYGGVYISVALLWLRYVDHLPLTVWDMAGGGLVLLGAVLIILQPNQGLSL